MTSKYGDLSVMQDAEGFGSPKWCQPYGCWEHANRGRWYRSSGSGPDQAAYDDSHAGHKVRGRNLVSLHVETGGGWHVEDEASNQNQLEVCRLCGGELDLQRDQEGDVIRSPGGQVDYCSKRCRLDVKNARGRAKRSSASPRKREPRPLPDLSVIRVSGLGELNIQPAEWNRLTPRRNGQDAHAGLPVLKFIETIRRRPDYAADKWAGLGRRHHAVYSADRISRRYGTGGRPKSPRLQPGWDQVETLWRFPEQRDCVTSTRLKQESGKVWCISH